MYLSISEYLYRHIGSITYTTPTVEIFLANIQFYTDSPKCFPLSFIHFQYIHSVFIIMHTTTQLNLHTLTHTLIYMCVFMYLYSLFFKVLTHLIKICTSFKISRLSDIILPSDDMSL
jgi:hypothetical protein